MEPTDLMAGLTRETRIRRDAQGRWWNDGEPIDHPKVARALDGWVDRAEDGRLCLVNDINWAYAEIEGPPYFVRALRWEDDAASLTLSGDRVETLDPATLRVGPDGALYCDVREGRVAARFDNHAAMQLGERLDEGERLRVGDVAYDIPQVGDALAPRGSVATSALQGSPK